MALDAGTSISSVHAGIIPLESPGNADTTLKSLSGAVGSTPIALDPAKYVGLILLMVFQEQKSRQWKGLAI